jgi:hypothetical protein
LGRPLTTPSTMADGMTRLKKGQGKGQSSSKSWDFLVHGALL